MWFIDAVQELLEANWALMKSNPAAFLVTFALGWVVARFMYIERIKFLKDRLDYPEDKMGGTSPDELRAKIRDLETRLDELRDPRLFTASQLSVLENQLQGTQGSIMIRRDMMETSAVGPHSQMTRLFRKIGWSVRSAMVLGDDQPPVGGLAIISRFREVESPLVAQLRRAFDAAGITYEYRPIKIDDQSFEDDVSLKFGEKR